MLYVTAGTKIRAFTLNECLGKGGMSAVWKANHAETGQDYALKILHGSVVDDENARQRFFEEGLIQSRVSHPNVVAVKGRIEEHPVHALVMEYVDGPTLQAYVKERPGGLFLPEVKAIATGILSGLNAAHRRGIVHRDVKPSNVLLARDFYTITPKLTDFGIAKVKYGRLKTVTSAPMGTPHFMSPEQLRDSKRVTHETDIYSFGVSLYYMATGEYPFDGDDLNALMLKIIQGGHQPPSHYRDDLPPELDELIERCMAPRPTDRPENCREVLEAILTIDWNQPEGAASRPKRKPKKPTIRAAANARPEPEPERPTTPAPRLKPTSEATPPPLPVTRQLAPTAEASAPRRKPQPTVPPRAVRTRPTARPSAASGPSPVVEASADPTWQLDSSEEMAFDDEDLTLAFRRRSRVPLFMAMLVIVAAAAVGTKYLLDWQSERDAATVVETGRDSLSSDGESTSPSEAAVGSATGSSAAVEPALGAAGVGSGAGLGSGLAAAGANTTPAVGQADGATLLAATTDADIPRATGSADGEGEEDRDAQPQSALLVVSEEDADEPEDEDRDDEDERADDEQEDEDEAEAERRARAEAEDEEEEEEEDEDDEVGEGFSWRDADQGGSRSRDTDRTGLTGREAELAAERAWVERARAQGSDELPPTLRATGPNDDPAAALGGSDTSTTAPQEDDAGESLTPVQINRTLGTRRAEFRGCFDGIESAPIEIRIRIMSDGSVSFARATQSDADRRIVACIVRELGSLAFDAYDGEPMNVRRTFTRVGPS